MYHHYQIDQTYDWNYENAPPEPNSSRPDASGEATARRWTFMGRRVASPVGVAAGPLLNGRWIRYYAALGFDVLTYKTVRSSARACYEPPNLTFVDCGQLDGSHTSVPHAKSPSDSWAVSFGMPSKEPDVWRRDVEDTRRQLPNDKVLSVSVVGTMQPGWSIDELADDYALCARWAVESGADCIETNFSCPNVTSCDGQLYQSPDDAKTVAERVRASIGDANYLIKIGHFAGIANRGTSAEQFLRAIAPFADGIVTTNSIAAKVVTDTGNNLFDGQPRGICGDAIRDESMRQTRELKRIVVSANLPLCIVGVGGISSAAHVRAYLDAGADLVQLATAAMLDPGIGMKIRRQLARR
ncbi:MAG: hypothetical protein KDB27_02700 [Planctomycetales bacterium]|nr:hypothetical protein [Planctomycetales bacterium]